MAEAHAATSSAAETHLLGVDADHFEYINVRSQDWHVSYTPQGFVIFVPRPRVLGRRLARGLYRLRNQLDSLLYPLPPWLAAAICLGFVGLVLGSDEASVWRTGALAHGLWTMDEALNPWHSTLAPEMRIAYLACLIAGLSLLLLAHVRRVALRMLLGYKGWMHDPPGRPSVATTAWAAVLKALYLGGRHPLTYAFQASLPSLPVPGLEQTVQRYLTSVEHIMAPADFEAIKAGAQAFVQSGGARRMQWMLWAKSWLTNYVSDWWLQYVYLRARSPLPINSNYYGLGFAFADALPTHSQTARAAVLTHQMMVHHQRLDKELLPPTLLRGLVPICMAQYEHLFSSTRIPMRDTDRLHKYSSGESRHVVVTYRGLFYRLEVYQADSSTLLSPADLAQQYARIVAHADALLASPDAPSMVERQVAALTTENRSVWAEVREAQFSAGLNRASLGVVESAIMHVALLPDSPSSLTEQARQSLHSDGTALWCDKSFTMIVFGNGVSTVHGEHSWGDAPALAHIWESVVAGELSQQSQLYDEKGHVLGRPTASLQAPPRLQWRISPGLATAITKAVARAQEDLADLQLQVTMFDAFGKGAIKRAKTSPDAFIQMALQLAYYREYGRHPNTYESSMTRLYRDGRTETIRSCSAQACAFVRAMDDPAVDGPTRLALLQAAARQHTWLSQQAMCGGGVDRHMFALYVVGMGLGIEAPFLERYFALPWHLSTSQIPHRQCPELWPKDAVDSTRYITPSGGFGPVASDGYGVSYMVAGEGHLFFHISCRSGCGHTSSSRFTERIFQALHDMHALLPAAH